jgi:hypothetical protein
MKETTMANQTLPEDIRAFFVEMGARGGRIGGKRRLETITPERRKEIARKAVAARWERKRTTD